MMSDDVMRNKGDSSGYRDTRTKPPSHPPSIHWPPKYAVRSATGITGKLSARGLIKNLTSFINSSHVNWCVCCSLFL